MEIFSIPKKCSASEPDIRTGQWELINDRLLKTSIDGITHTDSIVSVSSMEFIVNRPGDTAVVLKYSNELRTSGD